jgi:glycerol-3-phosphate acyltransferase PlsY
VLVFLADFLKGYLPLMLLQRFFPDNPWLATVTGLALVLGHCFSAYLGLRGGKGVATSLGCLTAVIPWVAMVSAVCYVVLLLATRISAIGSLGGMAVALLYAAGWKPSPPVLVLVVGISTIVLIRHHDNIRRLVGGFKARKK